MAPTGYHPRGRAAPRLWSGNARGINTKLSAEQGHVTNTTFPPTCFIRTVALGKVSFDFRSSMESGDFVLFCRISTDVAKAEKRRKTPKAWLGIFSIRV